MAIPASLIEDIRIKADIVSVVERYLPGLKKSGRNWRACCPFHNEKTPSFFVSPERGIYHCFGCGATGDVFKFVQEMEKISWPEAVRKLGESVGIKLPYEKWGVTGEADSSPESVERKSVFDALEAASEIYHRALFESYAGKNALEYLLKSRSLMHETIEKFRIGFSQGNIIDELIKKGFSTEVIVKSGLVKPPEDGVPADKSNYRYYEYMNGRIVFPIRDARGRTVAFGGRILDEGRQPKYLNTPESIVYTKGRHLYGFYEGLPKIKKSSEIVIVEGYLDVVVSHQCGIQNSVSCLGTAFTEYHASLVARYVRRVALMFDPDAAGLTAAVRAAENLMSSSRRTNTIGAAVQSPLEFYVVTLPAKTDPDEYLIKNGAREFIEYIRKNKKNFFEFHCDYLISKNGGINLMPPERKVAMLHNEIFPNLSCIGSPVLLEETLKIVSDKLKISLTSVGAEYSLFVRRMKNKNSTARASSDSGNAVRISRAPYLRDNYVKNSTSGPVYYGIRKSPQASENAPLSREETIVAILLFHPRYASRFSSDMFCDERCRAAWHSIYKWHSEKNQNGVSATTSSANVCQDKENIIALFPEDMHGWISSLIFRCPYVSSDDSATSSSILEEVVEKIFNEMENARIARRVEILKEELHNMLLKGEIDGTKNEEYISLLRRLKVPSPSSSPPR